MKTAFSYLVPLQSYTVCTFHVNIYSQIVSLLYMLIGKESIPIPIPIPIYSTIYSTIYSSCINRYLADLYIPNNMQFSYSQASCRSLQIRQYAVLVFIGILHLFIPNNMQFSYSKASCKSLYTRQYTVLVFIGILQIFIYSTISNFRIHRHLENLYILNNKQFSYSQASCRSLQTRPYAVTVFIGILQILQIRQYAVLVFIGILQILIYPTICSFRIHRYLADLYRLDNMLLSQL